MLRRRLIWVMIRSKEAVSHQSGKGEKPGIFGSGYCPRGYPLASQMPGFLNSMRKKDCDSRN